MFANIWDVSNAAMRRHDISGLWKLSGLTSVIALLPLLLISLLPANPEEQEKLAKSPVIYIYVCVCVYVCMCLCSQILNFYV